MLFVLLTGCTTSRVRMQQSFQPPESACRVAVIPFINETRYEDGELIFNRVLAAELLKFGKFIVAQEGDVQQVYLQMRIGANEIPTIDQVRIMAERLGSSVLIVGRIVEMTDDQQGRNRLPMLAVSLRMLDGHTGREFVALFHKREGGDYRKLMQFGVEHSITGLARRVAHEILERCNQEGLLKCE